MAPLTRVNAEAQCLRARNRPCSDWPRHSSWRSVADAEIMLASMVDRFGKDKQRVAIEHEDAQRAWQ